MQRSGPQTAAAATADEDLATARVGLCQITRGGAAR